MVEQVLTIWKVAVGDCVRQLQREIVCFEAAGKGWREGWQGILGQLRRRDSVRAGARGNLRKVIFQHCSMYGSKIKSLRDFPKPFFLPFCGVTIYVGKPTLSLMPS